MDTHPVQSKRYIIMLVVSVLSEKDLLRGSILGRLNYRAMIIDASAHHNLARRRARVAEGGLGRRGGVGLISNKKPHVYARGLNCNGEASSFPLLWSRGGRLVATVTHGEAGGNLTSVGIILKYIYS